MFNMVDSKLFSLLERLADLIILNLLFVISCIPIFTIGAAVTSLYELTLKMVDKREGYIVSSYIKSFRGNFKQSTRVWLIMFLMGVVLVADVLYAYFRPGFLSNVLYIIVMLGVTYLTFTGMYVYVLLARFENECKVAMKNAILMSLRHFPWTLLILLIHISAIVCMLLIPRMLFIGIPYYTFIGCSITAYVTSLIFRYLFEKYYGVIS